MLKHKDKYEIIYQPKKTNNKKASKFLSYNMMAYTSWLCLQVIIKSLIGKLNVCVINKYISIFWQYLLEKSSMTLIAFGREKIDINQPYIFMSNHSSFVDIPVVLAAAPGPIRMIAKKELFAIPIFGKALRVSGFPMIDRQNTKKAIKQLDAAKDKLKSGMNIWVSPEGTRGDGNNIGKFKKGGFYIASQLEIPIVPMYIDGATNVFNDKSLLVYPNKKVKVYFGEPLNTKGISSKDISHLLEQTREKMIELQELASDTK